MKIKYKVVGWSDSETSVDLKLADGSDVTAKVPCFIIEALSLDGTMGHTFRCLNDPGFHIGDTIEGSFEVTEAAPAEPAPAPAADPTL